MKRLLSISTLYPNAAQPRFGTFVARSLEALAARGDWEVTLMNPIGLPPLALGRYAELKKAALPGKENGVQVHRPTFTLIPKIGGRRNPSAIAKAVLPMARKLHASQAFDLVDAQFFYPDGPAAMRIAQALDLPFSAKARGADIHYWSQKAYGQKALLETGEAARGLLAVSQALAKDMVALGMPQAKIAVHYTGLDRDRFRPLDHIGLRAKLGEEFGIALAPDDTILATVGALIPRKGQALVIEAMRQIKDARLLLVGKGEDEAILRAQAEAAGLGDRVHFLGLLDHDALPVLLSAADIMVLPSASEGLANAWVEALACGTPIVICDAGGARELVTSPEAGVIVDRNADAIAAGIKAVLYDPPSPQDVAATVDRFDWKRHAKALSDYYDSLIVTR